MEQIVRSIHCNTGIFRSIPYQPVRYRKKSLYLKPSWNRPHEQRHAHIKETLTSTHILHYLRLPRCLHRILVVMETSAKRFACDFLISDSTSVGLGQWRTWLNDSDRWIIIIITTTTIIIIIIVIIIIIIIITIFFRSVIVLMMDA